MSGSFSLTGNDGSVSDAFAGYRDTGIGSGGGGGEVQAFEAAIQDLLDALEQRSGSGTEAAEPTSAGASAAPSGTATSPDAATSPASGGGDAPSGTNVNIDGGNVDGKGVVEQVDNNTGSAASFGWENAEGQIVGKLNLQNGQSGTFDVNAAGPDGTSARLIKLNPDGSIPAQSNLDEQNVTLNPNGTIQNSADVSEITAGSDPTKITITDGTGKTVGNGAPGGAYWYPTEDQQSNPQDNPMTMAMDSSDFYNNDFTD